MKWKLSGLLVVIVALGALALPLLAQETSPSALRPAIDARYQGIDWIDTATLARWMSAPPSGRPLVVLDVREPREFAVSHLRGARRVSPETRDFASLSLPRTATIVVYCSVGYRSAALAERLEAAGHRQVFNLQGGIFQWANEGRPIFRGDERVSQVHPYDAQWGLMLEERLRSPL